VIKLFADDTSLYVTVDTPQNAADIINRDLEKIHQWSVNWLVKFNPQKTETILGYMTKTLNKIFFFPPPKSEYFFQQHWESEYFFRKKP
jgi:hypothetical protein